METQRKDREGYKPRKDRVQICSHTLKCGKLMVLVIDPTLGTRSSGRIQPSSYYTTNTLVVYPQHRETIVAIELLDHVFIF